MWETNPFAKWGIHSSTRDGVPTISETSLWDLWKKFPDQVERLSDHEYWLYLDRPYHAQRFPSRNYFTLTADPHRKRAA